MALENWKVARVSRKDIAKFIEKNHYSGSINGCISDYCYALLDDKRNLKGGMIFGRMAMANQWKRFSDDKLRVIELRRLACVDDTPRNAESFFIGKALRQMKKDFHPNGIIVSYADKEYGHTGTIYKASNFTMVGEIKGSKIILYKGKRYHDKAIRTKYRGVLKPFAKELKAALDSGEAVYHETAGKYTYIYDLSIRK